MQRCLAGWTDVGPENDPGGKQEEQERDDEGSGALAEQKCIRHLSINRAKGLDSLAVILVGVQPFPQCHREDQQFTCFMGASRAKQLLGIVHG